MALARIISAILDNKLPVREDQTKGQRVRNIGVLILLIFGVVGTCLVLYATKSGVGLDADSAVYIGGARSFMEGDGLRMYFSPGPPMSTWAPLFPVILGLIGAIGVDPVDGARILNGVLFGALIVLIGFVLSKYANRSWFIPVFGSFLVLCSVDMLQVHAMAWSEPLFLFSSTTALLLAASHVDTPKRSLLIGCSIAVGIAYLSRYAGIVLVFTVMLGVALFGKETFYQRIRNSIMLGGFSSLPIILWPVINTLSDRSTTIREISFHPIISGNLEKGLSTVLAWVLPNKVVDWLMPGGAWLVFAVMFLVLVLAIVMRRWGRASKDGNVITQRLQCLPWLLFIFMVTYVVFLIVVISFVDGGIRLYYRQLSPVFVTGVLLAMCLLYDFLFVADNRFGSQIAVGLVAILFGGATLYQAGTWVLKASADGLGYSSSAWRSSELIKLVREIPPHASIYTNGHDVIYLLTGRTSTRLPIKWNQHKHRLRNDYQAELVEMKEKATREDAVIVYFASIRRGYLAPEEEVIESMPFELAKVASDGRMYRVMH